MTLINSEYQAQIRAMHDRGKFDNGAKQFRLIEPFLQQYQPATVLDFGCGKGALISEIKNHNPDMLCWGYDPGNPLYAVMPSRQFQAVISTDAIEHIEPEHLADNLGLIGARMERCGFFRIACHPAKKLLPDGRNCHLIVQEPDWWRQQIGRYMGARIVWERIEPFDRRDKNPILYGTKYDIIVEKT